MDSLFQRCFACAFEFCQDIHEFELDFNQLRILVSQSVLNVVSELNFLLLECYLRAAQANYVECEKIAVSILSKAQTISTPTAQEIQQKSILFLAWAYMV